MITALHNEIIFVKVSNLHCCEFDKVVSERIETNLVKQIRIFQMYMK